MGIEVLFDNTSHRSMGLVGGVIFVICGSFDEWFTIPYWLNCVMIATTIVIIEYLAGIVWNKDFSIWDYRNIPFNYKGQICLRFWLIWAGIISHLVIYLDNALRLIWA